MTTKIDDAWAVLAGLEGKLKDVHDRRDEAQTSAKELAFAAHTGDAEARKQLNKFEADVAKLAVEITGLDAAIIEAKRRVDAAAAADVDEVEREKARTALAMIGDLTEAAEQYQACLDKLPDAYARINACIKRFAEIGYAPTSIPMVRITMRAAHAASVQFTDLKTETLAPNERKNAVDVVAGWVANIRGRTTARLNKNAPSKAA
jgi:hypothetical protein